MGIGIVDTPATLAEELPMPFNLTAIIGEIDGVLAKYDYEFKTNQTSKNDRTYFDAPHDVRAELTTLLSSTIVRLAPSRDYGRLAVQDSMQTGGMQVNIPVMAGVLRALRHQYASGGLVSVQERIRSDVFSDFLEMAEYLVEDDGMKDPAAVLAGGVLEQHIRKLCAKHGIAVPDRPKLDSLNAELMKAGVYGKNDHKQVTAWAGVRNSAAHAKYDEYTAEQVKLMIAGVRDFLGRCPA
jgi:hypothetical protein